MISPVSASRTKAVQRAAALAAGVALTLGVVAIPASAASYTTSTVASVGAWPNSHDGMPAGSAVAQTAAVRRPAYRHHARRVSAARAMAARATNTSTVATVGGMSAAEPAPNAQAVANTPSGCGSLHACMWDYENYSGDLAVITGTGRFDNFATLGGSVCGNWSNCQESTYNSHTTCQVWWYTSPYQQGSRLINTPGSGSPNLFSTYEGNFGNKLNSLINEYC